MRRTASKGFRAALMSTIVIGAAIGGAGLIEEAFAAPARAQSDGVAPECESLLTFQSPGLEITSVRLVDAIPGGTIPLPERGPNDRIDAAFPRHCRVEGMINRRKGAGGVEYGIGFAIALPETWNGRLLFQGGGGFNGSIPNPYGMVAAGDQPALARGFAVIATDSGHKGAVFDTTFLTDQQASVDYALSAVPAVTTVGKQLAQRYYGTAPHHSYSVGCSTGGREGMMAAQRYPQLFDGVIAGDPAMRSGYTQIAGWNATVAFNRIAPRDAEGKPLRAQSFSAEDHQVLYSAVARQCDVLDGLADGLILNPDACHFEPAALQCEPGQAGGCLSAEKVEALKIAFAGPRDSRGRQVYPGYPYELGLLGGRVPMQLLPGAGYTPYGDPPSPLSLDVDAELERVLADPVQTLTDVFNWTDLGSFYRGGGKIMFYHGAADPWYSVYDTLNYFERNRAANPEFDASRFYSVPGMQHCAGGGLERFDMLTQLVDWVEDGTAPTAMTGSDWRRQVGTRPLCPWPQYAHYKGSGDTHDAANFECRAALAL
jgi:pimeloyl-ACP methyl ester carboxylesterase